MRLGSRSAPGATDWRFVHGAYSAGCLAELEDVIQVEGVLVLGRKLQLVGLMKNDDPCLPLVVLISM